MWRLANKYIKVKNDVSNAPQVLINEKNEKIETDSEIADIFNEFYVNVGSNLAKKIKNKRIYLDRIKDVDCELEWDSVTAFQVSEKINELKNNKAPGNDGITTAALKTISDFISEPLAYIINQSYEQEIFPNILKETVVIPIYKTGKTTEAGNYRPIAPTSNLSKIFEKCLKDIIINYLEKNKLLNENQFGFRKKNQHKIL